jgi:hypothetical protein
MIKIYTVRYWGDITIWLKNLQDYFAAVFKISAKNLVIPRG